MSAKVGIWGEVKLFISSILDKPIYFEGIKLSFFCLRPVLLRMSIHPNDTPRHYFEMFELTFLDTAGAAESATFNK